MPNKKTQTDLLLEEYFNQRGISFQYEPCSHKGFVPDYLFKKNKKDILIECEELENLSIDKMPSGAGSVDLSKTLQVLRKKIEVASKQLKPYSEDFDHLVILIGKIQGWPIELNELFWAMFGDPVIRVPLSDSAKARKKAFSDLLVKGSLRQNDPETREMCFRRSYIGGIGLIKSFNGLQIYKDRLFDKYHTGPGDDLRRLISQTMDFMDSGWKKYEKEIPKKFLNNPDVLYQKIEMIINPLSTKPLPKNIFNGRWDKNKRPTVIETLRFS